MNIDEAILTSKEEIIKKYKNGNVIFFEKDAATCYYQIVSGKVKMVNINEDGKEYVQGVFCEGNSFGEPPMLIGMPYPSTAVSIGETTVLKLRKETFLELMQQNPDLCRFFLIVLAKRIYSKSYSASSIINRTPEFKINAFLMSEKTKIGFTNTKVLIPFTRQEIANFTGLRVETVIRTIKRMEEAAIVEIKNRKIYF